MPHEELRFWQFNVPLKDRTPDCPDFLLNCSDKDRELIGKWDSEYEPLTWSEVKHIVRTSDTHLLSCCFHTEHTLQKRTRSIFSVDHLRIYADTENLCMIWRNNMAQSYHSFFVIDCAGLTWLLTVLHSPRQPTTKSCTTTGHMGLILASSI